MIKLLELREQLRACYLKHDAVIRAVGKFGFAFIVYNTLSSQICFQDHMWMMAVIFFMALANMFLPIGAVSFGMCAMLAYYMCCIGVEVGIFVIFLLILMLLLCLVFRPQNTVLIAAATIACLFNMGGVLPIAVGLMAAPLALIPLGFGIICSTLITIAKNNYTILSAQSDRLSSIEKLVYYADCLMQNKKMILIFLAFAVTVMIVYLIRKRPFAYAWSIAVAVGLTTYILIMMVGNVIFDISVLKIPLLLSSILGVTVAGLCMLFSFMLDGSKTEYLEYEDEEYHYFVKAIPKIKVAKMDKKVKKITYTENQTEEDLKTEEEFLGFDSEGFEQEQK